MAPLTVLALALSVVSSTVLAAPSSSSSPKTFKAPSYIPSIWKLSGVSLDNAPLTFSFVLEAGNQPGLEAAMNDIATSGKPWLTDDQIKSYVQPSQEAMSAVTQAAKSLSSSISWSPYNDKATVTTTVGQASKFFNAKFNAFTQNNVADLLAHRTYEFTVPASIAPYITDVTTIATFGSLKHDVKTRAPVSEAEESAQLAARATVPSSCNPASVVINCIRGFYGFDAYSPTTKTGVPRLGIMAFIGQNYAPRDLATWISKFRPAASGYSIAVNTSNGAINLPLLPGVEAALDTQTAAGIIYPLPSTFYDIGTMFTQGDIFLLAFQNFIGYKVANRPTVITISYGADEAGFTAAQANTMCNAAMQLTAAGMTIVVSSGDSGVDGSGSESCPPFVVTYPGGCPYILSVGATQNFSPEVMVDNTTAGAGFFSGAGFSNIFTTPSYQQSQVSSYIASLNGKYNGYYNKGGRAFPDVSAQGSRQNVVVSGQTELVGGTSASAPIFASGLTLLNDLLIKAGKPTVGWAQPKFYAAPNGTFSDITMGGSYDCASTAAGLPAKSGWDASSGLGTPIFANLRSLYGV